VYRWGAEEGGYLKEIGDVARLGDLVKDMDTFTKKASHVIFVARLE
jgi:hypothetical protein